MVILVTGGCGFIGSNFVRYLRERHPDDRVVVLDALTYAADSRRVDGLGAALVVGNVRDQEVVDRVLREHAVEAVVHFAAESHVDRSIAGPVQFFRSNAEGTAMLLWRAKKSDRVKRFVHVSTDEVYGHLGPDDLPFTETSPLQPRSPYAASKAASDCAALAWYATYGFPVVVTRCSNNYGPHQHGEKLIPLMISRALRDKTLPVYGDGLNVRDWIHVEDHCAAVDLALRGGRPGEVYNVGARTERTNIDVARAILAILGKPKSLVQYVEDRPGHDRRYAVDASKIERDLGWRPRRSFDEAFAETVRWHADNLPRASEGEVSR